MLKRISNFVSASVSPMSWAVLAVFGVVMALGASDVFAQATPTAVTYTEIVSFSNIFDTIRTSLGTIVAGALGLGLAIWGARYIFHVIKSMGR
jgi:hypothetical protein